MKLLTFKNNLNLIRPGIWIENQEKIIDLQTSNFKNGRKHNPAFDSLLTIIQGGEAALADAKAELENPHSESIMMTKDVTLCSPIPQPPQIRDCLCFEEHLTQAYAILRKIKASEEANPEAALIEFEKKGLFQIPSVWYQQPIYYKANRFSVIGTNEDMEVLLCQQLWKYELIYCPVYLILGSTTARRISEIKVPITVKVPSISMTKPAR